MVTHRDGKQAISTRQVKSISLGKGARISSDAIMLAIEHEIDVLFIDPLGQPQGRVWSQRYGSIANIRKNQVFFGRSKQAVLWIKDIILQKMHNQTALLTTLKTKGSATTTLKSNSISKIEQLSEKVTTLEGSLVAQIADKLRGLEGNASKIYFNGIAHLIPESYFFEKRTRNPAQDMFNSLLNYALGMLYGKIEGALIKAGIDPYLGILHRNEYNRPVLVYDAIEPFRVWAEQVVVNLCLQQIIYRDFFTITGTSFQLGSEGKRILIQCMQDYLDEIIGWRGKSRTRSTHIDLFAQDMAQMFKNAR